MIAGIRELYEADAIDIDFTDGLSLKWGCGALLAGIPNRTVNRLKVSPKGIKVNAAKTTNFLQK